MVHVQRPFNRGREQEETETILHQIKVAEMHGDGEAVAAVEAAQDMTRIRDHTATPTPAQIACKEAKRQQSAVW